MDTWKEIADFGNNIESHVPEASIETGQLRATMESIESIMSTDNSYVGDVRITQAISHLETAKTQLRAASDLIKTDSVLANHVQKLMSYINLIQEGLSK